MGRVMVQRAETVPCSDGFATPLNCQFVFFRGPPFVKMYQGEQGYHDCFPCICGNGSACHGHTRLLLDSWRV